MKKKAKENADELLEKKKELEEKKRLQEAKATEKEIALNKKAKSIGNYVHESVPISDNEVSLCSAQTREARLTGLRATGQQRAGPHMVSRRFKTGEEGVPLAPRSSYAARRLRPEPRRQDCRAPWLLLDRLRRVPQPCADQLRS